MKHILALTILFLSATCIYAQSCPSGTVPIQGGGTCATSAAGALTNLGGAALSGATFTGPVSAPQIGPVYIADNYAGADCGAKINAAITASGGIGTIQVGVGCGYNIDTLVNPIGASVQIQFTEFGTWWLSEPIINGNGGSIFGPPASESNPPTTLKAVANYRGMCPADVAGTAYSAMICEQAGSTLRDISIHGNAMPGDSYQPSSVVTSYAASGGVCTLQGTNTFASGQPIWFNIASGPTFLNPELPQYLVLSSGLSGSQFKVNCPGQTGSGSVTGTAAAAIQDVLLQNGGQGTISNVAIVFASEDGLHATSTFYPAPTASEVMALNTIVYIYSNTGLPQLYKVTVAGTGTSSYPSACTPALGSTCTWGGVTFQNIGATYDNTTSNMWVGPNVLSYQNGRDGLFAERDQDWLVSEKVLFEANGRDGVHLEDSGTFRFAADDWGGNGRYGFYAAAVNSACAAQNGAGGHFISGSQFAGNVSGDVVADGSRASTTGFCSVPSTYQQAGSIVITGNKFDGPATSASLTNAVQFVDAGGNDLTGNHFGGGYYSPLYNYFVTSKFSILTGAARQPNSISSIAVATNYAGMSYQAQSPLLLVAGVDVADATITPGAKTMWGDLIINGSLTVTNTGTLSSPLPENYVLQNLTIATSLGVPISPWVAESQGSGVNPVITACPSCADPFGNTGTGVYTIVFNLGAAEPRLSPSLSLSLLALSLSLLLLSLLLSHITHGH